MKAFAEVSTDQLWKAMEHCARQGRERTNWPELLEDVRVLAALIDERVQAHQRRARSEQLIREHRTGFRLQRVPARAGAGRQAASR